MDRWEEWTTRYGLRWLCSGDLIWICYSYLKSTSWKLGIGNRFNLRRVDKVPIFTLCDCTAGMKQPFDLSTLTDLAEESLILRMSIYIFDMILTTNILWLFQWPSAWDGRSFLISIQRFNFIFNVCHFDYTTVAWSCKFRPLILRLTTQVG